MKEVSMPTLVFWDWKLLAYTLSLKGETGCILNNSVIQIYDTELEKTEVFGDFLDFCETFDLERGKDDDDEESNLIGQFKVTLSPGLLETRMSMFIFS